MRPLLDVRPIRDIQRTYFDLLRRFFGHPFDLMTEHNLSPSQLAADMSTKKSLVDAFNGDRMELMEVFSAFWQINQVTVDDYLTKLDTMKFFLEAIFLQ